MEGRLYLNRYEALRLLGEGGMGKVYLARERDAGRQVVVKVMNDHLAADRRFRSAFARENAMMARFQHRHAVGLIEASAATDEQLCLVMEYVDGVSLEAIVKREGPLAPARVGRLLGQLCGVLQAAHDAGILHRDLTAANVMVVDPGAPSESIKVMDFGLARSAGGAGPYIALEKLTGSGQSIGGGTPDYVCPEQIRGETVDHRGDLYSVGVLLFYALTGHLPFEEAGTVQEILLSHINQEPPTFAGVGVEGIISAAIEAVVQSCLRKFPTERPQSARELGEQFERALGHKITFEPERAAAAALAPLRKAAPTGLIETLEAWMPESIAVIKLRGFVADIGGEIVDSEPGLIRVLLPSPGDVVQAKASGFLGWLGLGKPAAVRNLAVMELHMESRPGTRSQIQIQVAIRPEKPEQRVDPAAMKAWSEAIVRELRAYLIGR